VQPPPEWVDWLIQGVRVTSGKVTKADDLATVGKAQAHAGAALNLQGQFAKAGDNQHTGGPDNIRTNGSEGGTSAAYLAARLKKAGRGMKSPNLTGRRGKELGYHGNVVMRGNNEEYIVRRLKRDDPGLAIALARGEFPSARAAGIAAGFVKPSPPSLQLKDPAPTAQKLLAKKGQTSCRR
jgi:hypothetical protein